MTSSFAYNGEYPRPLSTREREWIEWILPSDRPSYRSYRDAIAGMMVIGEGRRGKGEIILGAAEDRPDFNEPLAPVIAYGAIETTAGTISVTLREILNNQVSVEIVNQQSDVIPEKFEERRRWTYSAWKPGKQCPQCQHPPREVPMHTFTSEQSRLVLTICSYDKRLWVYDESTGMNRLIPLTNYYNELMLYKNIRDPKLALDAKRMFIELSRYSDEDLTHAFLTYNKIKTKIPVRGMIEADRKEKHGLGRMIRNIFGTQQ